MNILVTGATGFVGQLLCQRLMEQNYTVAATIRRPEDQQKLPPAIKTALVKSLPELLPEEIIENTQAIIYLAARVHQLNDRGPDALNAYRQINTHGAIALAQQALKCGVKRFIYLSSIKVNGESTTNRIAYSEQDLPQPQDPYGISKWEAEQGLLELAQTSDLEVVILRPPLIYGPQVKANFLQLLKLINKGIPFPFASIHNHRSLLYVGNLVDAIVTSIDHPNAKNQTFLVSDGHALSTPELIGQLGQALDKPAKLFPFPPALLKLAAISIGKANVAERLLGSLRVDSSKIKQTLHWSPPYTTEEGLKITANWFASTFEKDKLP